VVAIKPMSLGAWPAGAERKRQWWYRTLEDQADIELAFRFTLSRPAVVSGFSPAWLDLQEKAVAAGKALRPFVEEDAKKLEEMAKGRGSIFQREEDMVAMGRMPRSPYPHRPHECEGRGEYC